MHGGSPARPALAHHQACTKGTAQEGYTTLAAMVHDKFSLKIKPNSARDSIAASSEVCDLTERCEGARAGVGDLDWICWCCREV
jgi:hypothetical protein